MKEFYFNNNNNKNDNDINNNYINYFETKEN